MISLPDVADLRDVSGRRNAHSKVMILGVTSAVLVIVGLVLVLEGRHFAWPDVSVLGLLLLAPYGLDGYKTLVKLRFGVAEATATHAGAGTMPARIQQRRGIGAAEGVEPTT